MSGQGSIHAYSLILSEPRSVHLLIDLVTDLSEPQRGVTTGGKEVPERLIVTSHYKGNNWCVLACLS